MLSKHDAVATVAVKDLNVAKAFYEGTLGLTLANADSEVLIFTSGRSRIFVYTSQYAGTNQATAVTWPVGDDLDQIVQSLKAKNVTFEHYDLPGTTRQGDVHLAGGLRVVWFKDPDGNIISVFDE